jgi:nucleoside-diphosphate-sugar epimerase
MGRFDFLVTGGAGFLGASLARRLLTRGCSVLAVDVAPFDRLADLSEHPGLTCRHGDVRDAAAVSSWVGEAERVVHLAAVVGVRRYMEDPALVLDVNLRGTMDVLRACHDQGRPVLYASTSETYGLVAEPLSETSRRCYGSYRSPRWSYAISKAAGEQYAQALAMRGLVHTTTRYFNVYGPGLDRPGAGRVISRFLGFLQTGEPLPLIDGGDHVRAFCWVDEAVAATEALALAVGRDPAVTGRAFNVGRADPITIRHLAERMIHLSGHTAGTVVIPGTEVYGPDFEEIPIRIPDVRALREAIGFEAKVDLDDGLRRTLAHYGLLADS